MVRLTKEERRMFEMELKEAPCTRGAIEAVFTKFYGPSPHAPYPDEWYADKDNRLRGEPTGHLRFGRSGVKWVSYQALEAHHEQ